MPMMVLMMTPPQEIPMTPIFSDLFRIASRLGVEQGVGENRIGDGVIRPLLLNRRIRIPVEPPM